MRGSIAIPVALAILVAALSFDGAFVYDDNEALIQNPVVNGEASILEAWTRDFWGRPMEGGINSWRPVMPMIWSTVWNLSPNSPTLFRVLSLLLHALCTWLVFILATRLDAAKGWATAVASVFAVHALNTEAVSALVAQADLLSFALLLLATITVLSPLRVGTVATCALLFIAACLTKESATIFAPMLIGLAWLKHGENKRWLGFAVAIVLITTAMVVFQLELPRRETVSAWGNTLAHEAKGAERFWLGLYTIGRSIELALLPLGIAPSHGYAAIELHKETLMPHALFGGITLALGLAAGLWSIVKRRVVLFVGLCFLFAPALLQSHFFVPLITDLAERLLYPTTLGISILASTALFALLKANALRKTVLVAVVVAMLAVGIGPRRAWTTNYSLWQYAVQVEPKAMRHQFNFAGESMKLNRFDDATYHRLIAMYLVNRFPKKVEWERVQSVSGAPKNERVARLPAALFDDKPCPIVIGFLTQIRPVSEAWHDHALSIFLNAYPRCFQRPGS